MDPFIGEIRMFTGSFAPQDWAFCHGQLLQVQQYTALFSILGTTYGGDGRNTFGVPDLRGRVPVGAGAGPGLTPHSLGESHGFEFISLDESHLPVHKHAIPSNQSEGSANLKVHQGVGDTDDPTAAKSIASQVPASMGKTDSLLSTTDANTTIFGAVTGVQGSLPSDTENAGSGQAHFNMQPYLAVNFIIALDGIYPPRS